MKFHIGLTTMFLFTIFNLILLCGLMQLLNKRTVTEEDIQAVLHEAKMDELLIKEGRYLCEVCLKEGNHFDYECPYFVLIPKGAKIGSGYDIVCANCGEDHQNDSDDDAGVLGEDWQGRAVLKVCTFCGGESGHWYDECPMRKKT